MIVTRRISGNGAHCAYALLQAFGAEPGFAVFGNPTTGLCWIFLNPTETYRLDGRNSAPLREAISALSKLDSPLSSVPFIAGYLSYEYGCHAEDIPLAPSRTLNLPLGEFCRFHTVIRVTPTFVEVHALNSIREDVIACLLDPGAPKQITPLITEHADFPPDAWLSLPKKAYGECMTEILERIRDGMVYQVNLCEQITLPLPRAPLCAVDFFWELCLSENAPFAVFFRSVAHDSVVAGISPELLFLKEGTSVVAKPIKGTTRKEGDPYTDKKKRDELLSSVKNRAELAMIVDLFRHDIGKIALPGRVQVKEFPVLQELDNLFHLAAEITGEVPKALSSWEVLEALFPSGSITGTPKIAAMHTISELEPVQRGPYCGAFAMFSGRGATCNVAIRTAVLHGDSLVYGAGGGITIRSNPTEEWSEWISKSSRVLEWYQQRMRG